MTGESRDYQVDSRELDGSEAADQHTPNDTPLPAGPPPPQAVQAERPLSHGLSGAIAGELVRQGITSTEHSRS